MAKKPGDSVRNDGRTGDSRESSPNNETGTALPIPLVQELSVLLTQILVADIRALPIGALGRGGHAHMRGEEGG